MDRLHLLLDEAGVWVWMVLDIEEVHCGMVVIVILIEVVDMDTLREVASIARKAMHRELRCDGRP